MTDFIQILTSNIDTFAKWIEETHNIPNDVVITKWNDLTGMNLIITDDNTTVCEDEEPSEIFIQRPGTLVPYLCQHVFKIGNRAGQQCSKKPKGNATKCCSHKDQESKTKKTETKKVTKTPKKVTETKKVTKTPKKVTKETNSSDSDSEVADSEVESTKKVTRRKVKKSKEKNFSDSDSNSSE